MKKSSLIQKVFSVEQEIFRPHTKNLHKRHKRLQMGPYAVWQFRSKLNGISNASSPKVVACFVQKLGVIFPRVIFPWKNKTSLWKTSYSKNN